MDEKKSEFSKAVTEMSQFAGVLAGTAVIVGKKTLRYLNDLTTVETSLKPPTEQESKDSKTTTQVD
ncbi:hypothetical protein ACFL3G_00295 [Planctomycetota bacterium]